MSEGAENARAREDALEHLRARDLSLARLHDFTRQEILVQDHEHLSYHPPVLVNIAIWRASLHALLHVFSPCGS